MTTGPDTPSIRTITPDPDSSVGLVLPGAGGLMASTETTLGAIWRMTAANRSPSRPSDRDEGRGAGGAGRPGCATTGSALLSSTVPATPPPNAQVPRKAALTYRFIGGVVAVVSGLGTGLESRPDRIRILSPRRGLV